MQFKENDELKDFNRDELINQLITSNHAIKALRSYLDLLGAKCANEYDNLNLTMLHNFLFGNGTVDNAIEQLQDADSATDNAIYYLLNLEKLDNKKGE